MTVKPRVCGFDELPVKSPPAAAGLVSGHEQYGFLLRVESEGHAPNSTCGIEAEFLHVVVLGTMKSIGCRALKLWAEFREQTGLRHQFVLNLRLKRIEFRLEFRVEINPPRHVHSMVLKAYGVKYMCLGCCNPMGTGPLPTRPVALLSAESVNKIYLDFTWLMDGIIEKGVPLNGVYQEIHS